MDLYVSIMIIKGNYVKYKRKLWKEKICFFIQSIWTRTQEQLGSETDRGKDIKNLYEIILASTNRMDNLRTGQDNDWFWTDYISRSEISCNGYEIAWYSLFAKRGFTNFP